MVEDNILDHAKSGLVEALDHLAVLEHSAIRVQCIAAFRRKKVHRVVAPVERIGVLDRGDCGLLLRAIRWEDAKVRSGQPGGLILVNAGEMKAGQQMHGF